ncbi:MAG: hypothetical protein JST00_20890 [Deltaproteobacteria bacterium]|nr:hypothetical protein [Deltaproteobacteria bacterium]
MRAAIACMGVVCVVLSGCSSGEPLEGRGRSRGPTATGEDEIGSNGEGAPSSSGQTGTGTTGAKGKPRQQGVVFVHGTGDQGDASAFACNGAGDAFHCEVKVAVEYWEMSTIDSERTRLDGSKRPYAVVGCPLGSQAPWPMATPVRGTNEPGSAACTATEIDRFLDGPDGTKGTDDDIDDIVVVTHSGGSNVVRYILEQRSRLPEFGRIHGATRGAVMIAPPTHGTYLADWVFTNGTLPSAANSIIRLFGGEGFYDDDGTGFIRTTEMARHNADPAKLASVSKDIGGVPIYVGGGTYPTASGDAAKVDCANGTQTKALAVLHELYLDTTDANTFRDGCSDGFITCRSAMALAQGDADRVVFGRLDDGRTIGKTAFRAHNQSRRTCDAVDVDVRATVNRIFDKAPKLGLAREVRRFEAMAEAWSARIATGDASTAAIVGWQRHVADGELDVEVESLTEASLGLRATGVKNGDVVGEDQVTLHVRPGRTTFTLRLPPASEPRDVALVRHDDATTLDVRATLSAATP